MSAIASERTRPAGEATREPADHRLQVLLGAHAWARLPVQVQRRFSKPLGAGATRLYRGRVVETRLSLSGRILGQIARLIGAPLPLQNNAVGPSTVSVVEDGGVGGQVWTRVYPQPGRFPQVVHSAKRFRGPTGLEEYIGCGIGMELTVAVEAGRLVFRSRRYFLEWGRTRLVLPGWLGPGAMEIVHAQEDAAEFSFTLTVHHPWLGELVRQQALYQDA